MRQTLRTAHPRALKIYLAYEGISSGLFWMTFAVFSVYHIQMAGLNPLQLVLCGTVLEAAVFLFEIPTGIVADLYSRRLSVIIGTFLIGTGFLLDGSLPFYIPILMAQALWGIGYTFTSGALQAWITDEIGEESAGGAFLRGAQFAQLGTLIGVLAGTALGTVRINLPVLLSGGLFFALGFFLMLNMPEDHFAPTPQEDRSTWGSMLRTFRQGVGMVRRRPALLSILGAGLIFGLYSEGLDRLWEAHLLEHFVFPAFNPVVWIGGIKAISMLGAMIATGQIKHRINLSRMKALTGTLLATSVIIITALLGFSWTGSLGLATALIIVITIVREVNVPIYTAWVNHRLDSSVRATVFSMSGQFDAIGQVLGGPPIGFLARQVSVQAGLTASGLLLVPVLFLLGLSRKNYAEE